MRLGSPARLLVFVAPLISACRSPTQITFQITTDVACSQLEGTSFTSGPLAALTDGRPAASVAHGCASPADIGSVVVVPSGNDDDLVAVALVTGVGVEPDQCGPTSPCIVAKRALRFIPHTPLVVRVAMDAQCEGVVCEGDQTCEQGQCVSAVITDPTQCEGAGCTGSILAPVDGGAPITDAGPSDGVDSASPCVPACTAPNVCERYSSPSCEDPTWADWPMPNTPVDSPPAPNLRKYADNGDGTVTDGVTGLMWQKTTAPSPDGGPSYPQTAAVAYCASLALGGHHDWRLPSLIELVSILDWSATSGPAVDSTYFPSTVAAYYWSSTQVANAAGAWLLDFSAGYTAGAVYAEADYARCVR